MLINQSGEGFPQNNLIQDRIRDLEKQIRHMGSREEDSERGRTMLLKGFKDCEESEAKHWLNEEIRKSGSKNPIDIHVKGEFKSMIWAKFEDQKTRDEAIKKLAKPSFKFKGEKIWAEKDLKYTDRQLINFLLGIRKGLIDRDLDKGSIWIDKDAFSLYYFDELPVQVKYD